MSQVEVLLASALLLLAWVVGTGIEYLELLVMGDMIDRYERLQKRRDVEFTPIRHGNNRDLLLAASISAAIGVFAMALFVFLSG